MDDSKAFLLFLYGLFWAEIIATSARYNGFLTATLWAKWEYRTERLIRLKRLLVSIVFLNILPIVWLGFLYTCVVPESHGFVPLSMSALASLSIFGILRLCHGIVASCETQETLYTCEELKKFRIHGKIGPLPRKAHIVPGLCYLVLSPAAAIMVGGLQWVV